MAAPKQARQLRRARNGDYRVGFDKRGWYCATVSVGRDEDGKSVRKYVRGDTPDEVHEKIKRIRFEAHVVGPQKAAYPVDETFADWADEWLIHVRQRRETKTYVGYESNLRLYILPFLGTLKLSDVTPEHIERMLYSLVYAQTKKPVSDATRKAVYSTVRACLGFAVTRRRLPANPASLVEVRTPPSHDINPMSREAALRVLQAAHRHRHPARWLLALLVGLRQGEALGLRWQDLDLTGPQPTLHVRQTRTRPVWMHGCDHQTRCGPAAECPQRWKSSVFKSPKSRSGRRDIILSPTVVQELHAQRRIVARMRMQAGASWEDNDLVFPTPTGRPQDSRNDSREWHQLLVEANVPDARLHDARHFAATIQLYLGMNPVEATRYFGWASHQMVDNYGHVVDQARSEAAARLETYMFGDS